MTETTISAPIRQKGRGTKTQTRAVAPGNVNWTDTLPIVCTRAATMLRVVAERLAGGSDAESGYRLSALAARTLETVAASDQWVDLHALDNHLFDVCALITSAKGTEGESISSDLAALLGYALELVSALASTRCTDPLQGDVDLMHTLLREPMPELPAAKPNRGAEFDPLHGNTPSQIKTVLECIAVHARTLDLMLMELGERSTGPVTAGELTTAINGSQLIASGIGAMADDAIEGEIYGDWHTWMYGPNFADAGKAVQA